MSLLDHLLCFQKWNEDTGELVQVYPLQLESQDSEYIEAGNAELRIDDDVNGGFELSCWC